MASVSPDVSAAPQQDESKQRQCTTRDFAKFFCFGLVSWTMILVWAGQVLHSCIKPNTCPDGFGLTPDGAGRCCRSSGWDCTNPVNVVCDNLAFNIVKVLACTLAVILMCVMASTCWCASESSAIRRANEPDAAPAHASVIVPPAAAPAAPAAPVAAASAPLDHDLSALV